VRALTIRQPWAWAILHAGKDIENRSWRNKHTVGTIAVHVSGNADPVDELPRGVRRPNEAELIRGAIIGVVDVVEVIERSRSKWFHGPLGWVLEDPRSISTPIPCTGRLGLWEIPAKIERTLLEQLRRRGNRSGK